jgi:hypothetical protein
MKNLMVLAVLVIGCGSATADDSDAPVTELDCHDAVDNDLDGYLDCADSDCLGAEGCSECGNDLVEPGEDCEPGLPPATCTTDCGSPGTRSCDGFCRWEDECVVPSETCNDVDDDCDGGTDEGLGNCECDVWVDFETDTGSVNPVDAGCGAPSNVELIADGYEGQGLSIFCSAEYSIPLGRSFRVSVRVRPEGSTGVLHSIHPDGFSLRVDHNVYIGGSALADSVGTWADGEWVLLERDVLSTASTYYFNGEPVGADEWGYGSLSDDGFGFDGSPDIDNLCIRYLD